MFRLNCGFDPWSANRLPSLQPPLLASPTRYTFNCVQICNSDSTSRGPTPLAPPYNRNSKFARVLGRRQNTLHASCSPPSSRDGPIVFILIENIVISGSGDLLFGWFESNRCTVRLFVVYYLFILSFQFFGLKRWLVKKSVRLIQCCFL